MWLLAYSEEVYSRRLALSDLMYPAWMKSLGAASGLSYGGLSSAVCVLHLLVGMLKHWQDNRQACYRYPCAMTRNCSILSLLSALSQLCALCILETAAQLETAQLPCLGNTHMPAYMQ